MQWLPLAILVCAGTFAAHAAETAACATACSPKLPVGTSWAKREIDYLAADKIHVNFFGSFDFTSANTSKKTMALVTAHGSVWSKTAALMCPYKDSLACEVTYSTECGVATPPATDGDYLSLVGLNKGLGCVCSCPGVGNLLGMDEAMYEAEKEGWPSNTVEEVYVMFCPVTKAAKCFSESSSCAPMKAAGLNDPGVLPHLMKQEFWANCSKKGYETPLTTTTTTPPAGANAPSGVAGANAAASAGAEMAMLGSLAVACAWVG